MFPEGAILDVARRAGLEPARVGSEYVVRCPWPGRHRNGDAHPSCRLNAEKNTYYCDPCGASGGVLALARELGVPPPQADAVVRASTRTRPKRTNKDQPTFVNDGPIDESIQRLLADHLGKAYPVAVWRRVGALQGRLNGQPCIAFPLPRGGYKLCLYKQPDQKRSKLYSWRFADGGGSDLTIIGDDEEVLLVAGEWDMLAALDAGFNCVATTSTGEGSWKASFNELLRGRCALIVYDLDADGRAGAAKVTQALADAGVEAYDIELPLRGKEEAGAKDLSDYLALNDAEALRGLLRAARSGARSSAPSGLTAYTACSTPALREKSPSLADAALHGIAGEFTRLVEPHTEADPAAILVQFLVAAGCCVGRGPHFRVEGDEHHTNLFATLVGRTAKGRKGTSWGHVRRLFGFVDPSWADRGIASGLSSGEGLTWAVRDPIYKTETARKKTGIVESEQVLADPGVDDKRLLVVETEFASPLRILQRDGNTLSPGVRNAWDSGDLRTLTKNSPTRASGAHIGIIGHITRDELLRYLDRTELANGFANRFLWVVVRRSKLLPDGGALDINQLQHLAARLGKIVTVARRAGEVDWSPGARERWHTVYPELSAERQGMFGAATSRAEAITVRLALLYALLDLADAIQPEHLDAALAVWGYAEASARTIFGDATGDPVADRVLAEVRARPDGMTRDEVRDFLGRNVRAPRIQQALDHLGRLGYARCEREATGGRPAERWFASNRSYAVYAVNAERG